MGNYPAHALATALTLTPFQDFLFVKIDALVVVVVVLVVVVDGVATAQRFEVEAVDSLQSSLIKLNQIKVTETDTDFYRLHSRYEPKAQIIHKNAKLSHEANVCF